MSQDIENKVDEKVAEEVEKELEAPVDDEGDGLDEEDLIEAGYKVHKFSLFDSPIEIAAIVFMAVYVIYSLIMFAVNNTGGTDLQSIFNFLFDLVWKVVPGVILIVVCEIHEKTELLEYNLSLNSEYMARYQMDLLDKIDDIDEKN